MPRVTQIKTWLKMPLVMMIEYKIPAILGKTNGDAAVLLASVTLTILRRRSFKGTGQGRFQLGATA